MRYPVIVERASKNYCAYCPDVDGCIRVGYTIEETIGNLTEALTGHIQGLKEHGYPIPEPAATADDVEIAA